MLWHFTFAWHVLLPDVRLWLSGSHSNGNWACNTSRTVVNVRYCRHTYIYIYTICSSYTSYSYSAIYYIQFVFYTFAWAFLQHNKFLMTWDRICAWLQCNQVNAAYAQYYVYDGELQLAAGRSSSSRISGSSSSRRHPFAPLTKPLHSSPLTPPSPLHYVCRSCS